MIYHDMLSLRKELSGAADIIERENAMQCPTARLIVAGTMYMSGEEDGMKDLVAFFDVGTKDKVLWAWVSGDIYGDDVYIDEYYEITIDEAKQYCGEVFNMRKQ